MKKIKIKCRCHTIIIVCVILYSFLCWTMFFKFIGIRVWDRLKNAKSVSSIETEDISAADSLTNVVDTDETEPGNALTANHKRQSQPIMKMCINALDDFKRYADRVNALWYGLMLGKSSLSRIDSLSTYYTTREIASSQVVKGKENWLFYKSPIDGNPIGDFEGTNKYSSEEMNSICQKALWTQKKLEERGIKSAIMAAPNKENIYSEFMPDIYTHAETSSTDILIDFMAANGVNIISPKKELLDNRSKYQLYYSYDTHWNQLGAYIGVREVLKAWDIDNPALDERDILSGNLSENYHYCAVDDLAQMVGLREAVFNDETEYWIEDTGIMAGEEWGEFEEEQENEEVSYFFNKEAQIQTTVLLVGDSFRTSMIPALQETFSDIYVVHRFSYKPDLLDEINPEYLLLEYVERYSSQMSDIASICE